MPSIKLETSAIISKEAEKTLSLEIANLAAAELNKPLSVVQVRIQSGITVTFGDNTDNGSAFLHIALIGEIAQETKAALPEKFASILEKYGIDRNRLFLHYTETGYGAWGWL